MAFNGRTCFKPYLFVSPSLSNFSIQLTSRFCHTYAHTSIHLLFHLQGSVLRIWLIFKETLFLNSELFVFVFENRCQITVTVRESSKVHLHLPNPTDLFPKMWFWYVFLVWGASVKFIFYELKNFFGKRVGREAQTRHKFTRISGVLRTCKDAYIKEIAIWLIFFHPSSKL